MKFLIYLSAFFAVFYFIVAFYLYITQDEKIFKKKWATPFEPKMAKLIYFTTSDGIRLEGGYVENKKNAPLILYFSGNANNVLEFLDKITPKIKNYNFLGFNYPGYSRSEGVPCEECIYKYSLEIFDRYKPKYLIGRSLGSAVASFIGANRKVKGLLLITPIDSVINIAKSKYPFLPVKILVKHKFEAYKYLKKIKSPISVLLVKNDNIVPEKNIQNVLNSIVNLKEVEIIEGVNHGNIYEYPQIYKITEKLIDSLRKK